MTSMVPAATPTRLSDAERAAIDAAIRRVTVDGPWIGGAEVDGFEAEFGSYVGATHVVGCASGTDAIVLALMGLNVPGGSEVLVPAHDGGYAATAARLAGLVPVPVDVDATRATPTVATLDAAAASTSPRALIITHLHGDPVDLSEIDQWRRARGMLLIEDCAQAHGARAGGRPVGSAGDAAAYSFYPTKNLGAIGDAGAIVFAHAEAAARARSLAQYGWDEHRRIDLAGGRNSRLDSLQAAVLRARLPFLDARNARRVTIRARYVREVPRLNFLGDGTGVAHHAVVRSTQRDALLAHLSACGIAPAIHYAVSVGDMPGLAIDAASTPQARLLAGQIVSVPCTPELQDEEVDAVIAALSKWSGR
ncbi:DegT/DnrJ/EryC1/StrS family aminotransferase [soil metagenome]